MAEDSGNRKKKKFMKRRAKKRPFEQTDIARERIEILFSEAEKMFPTDPELSDRYVEIARKISTRYNVPISSELKRRFCRKCGKFLVFGKNARVRVDPDKKCVSVTCEGCGNTSRHGICKDDE